MTYLPLWLWLVEKFGVVGALVSYLMLLSWIITPVLLVLLYRKSLALQRHFVELFDRLAIQSRQQQVERLLRMFRESPYTPPGRSESEAIVGSEVLASLIEQGMLVKLGSSSDTVLFLRESYEEAIAKLVAYLQEHHKMTAAEARDILGTTRKYILPLLEHMDERHITRRVGDERISGTAGL